ncbi:FadR/GntR family transcriptional regulator [Nocardia sp. NPDC052278]|uniref:FadR/GntR family transcriptional regulator n=1 Tax=unclassified Nocardia TaxID=2637762 RepID=UPI0036C830CA
MADSIRRKIVLGELRDGDYLPNEAQLLQNYGVSRPVLREAIRILQSEDLLKIRRGSKGGALVSAPKPEPLAKQAGALLQYQRTTLVDVFRTRAIIEPPAVRLLAENRTPEVIDRLHTALQEEAESIESEASWGPAHAHFHTLVVELSGSNTLALFANIMSEITRAHTQAVIARVHNNAERRSGAELSHRVHRKLVQLVAAGKAGEAEELWRKHLEETTEQMLLDQGSRELLELFQ